MQDAIEWKFNVELCIY